MGKNVKGILFVDYIRMIKSRRNLDWGKYLTPDDMSFLDQDIVDSEWYPLDTFERMGVGILKEIASGDMEKVRLWGRQSTGKLINAYESLVCKGDSRESMLRFQVLRKSFFNFGSIEIKALQDDCAILQIGYGMSKIAEEAATYQALGFFEGLLKVSGAKDIRHEFKSKSWEGDPATILDLHWS